MLDLTHYLAPSYYNNDKHSERDGDPTLYVNGWYQEKSTMVFPKPVMSVYLIRIRTLFIHSIDQYRAKGQLVGCMEQ